MKKLKNGLYVGKFIAYHKGHQNCINKFSKLCDKLNLVLCANSKNDKVPYSIRKKWLEKDILSGLSSTSNIKLHILIEDKIKPYPEGIAEWCQEIKKLVIDPNNKNEKIDVMFGNEEYVKECANEFGSFYYVPDQERTNHNISSTKIITNSLKYYDYLADVSKPYFNKTVLITGSESTGKSQLAKKLSLYFNGKYVLEYGREYEEFTKATFKMNSTRWNVEDYIHVAKKHDAEINNLLKMPVKLVFVDTDALITQMYCELYINQNSCVIENIIKHQKFDLILFLGEKNTKWVADGIRFLENERGMISNFIKEKLKHYNRKYIVLENVNGYDDRCENAKNIIKEAFKL
jgi:HTH-type transcriptional repressor of NAD biosynthesis genes